MSETYDPDGKKGIIDSHTLEWTKGSSTADRPICEAFDWIRQYAVLRGWVPIGYRVFEVGPWTITVNGTQERRDRLDPYHALITHRDLVGLMIVHPFGGTVGGWQHTEEEFCEAMRAALAEVRPAPKED